MAKSNVFDWDTTANNNSDVGGNNIAENCLPSTLNNMGREMMAQLVRELADKGSDITAAATTNIAASGTSAFVKITGTTTITSFGTPSAGEPRRLIHWGAATPVTHNATSMILLGGASRTMAAGDISLFAHEGSGNWRELMYQKADGSPTASIGTSNITNAAVTYAKIQDVSAASRLLGRGSASGSGDAEEITPGAGLVMDSTTLKGAFGAQLLHIRDEKASGTDGGATAATTWTKHTLDDVKTNEISGASEASSVITLPAGTYHVDGFANFYSTDDVKLRLRNTTAGSTAVVGSNNYCNNGGDFGSCNAHISGRFTIASESTLELQYYATVANAGDGLGRAVSSGEVEIYADVRIWKVA